MRKIELTEDQYKLLVSCIKYMYDNQVCWLDEEEHITNKEFVESMHKQHEDLKFLKEYVENLEKNLEE
jgi:hypothetical protein